jgi:hypothetical protein
MIPSHAENDNHTYRSRSSAPPLSEEIIGEIHRPVIVINHRIVSAIGSKLVITSCSASADNVPINVQSREKSLYQKDSVNSELTALRGCAERVLWCG